MDKVKKILFIIVFLLGMPWYAHAKLLNNTSAPDQDDQANAFKEAVGFEDNSVESIVAIIISVFLGLLGVIFVILIIIAGFNWMTANGDETKIEKAQKTIKAAIIGLIIIVAAYSITKFVFEKLPGGNSSSSGSSGLTGSP